MTKRRISYIDALRGLTMALVVYTHVFLITFGTNKIFAAQLASTVMLTPFFFISGFVAYKTAKCWTGIYIGKMIGRKFMTLIIPAAIFFCLWHLTSSKNMLNSFIYHGFQYYWFPFTLFGIFLIYYTASWISHLLKSDKAQDIALILLSGIAFAVLVRIFNIYWYQKFALSNVCLYLPFFVIGVFTRKYYSQVEKFLKKTTIITVALIVFVTSLFLCYHPTYSPQIPHLASWLLRLVVVKLSGMIIVFIIFLRNATFFDSDNRVAKTFTFIGKRTLDIYLIHYLLLPDLTIFERHFTTNDTFILQVSAAMILAAIIIAGSIAISSIIRMSPFLGYFMLGAKKE